MTDEVLVLALDDDDDDDVDDDDDDDDDDDNDDNVDDAVAVWFAVFAFFLALLSSAAFSSFSVALRFSVVRSASAARPFVSLKIVTNIGTSRSISAAGSSVVTRDPFHFTVYVFLRASYTSNFSTSHGRLSSCLHTPMHMHERYESDDDDDDDDDDDVRGMMSSRARTPTVIQHLHAHTNPAFEQRMNGTVAG
jgi:hypothetical protein